MLRIICMSESGSGRQRTGSLPIFRCVFLSLAAAGQPFPLKQGICRTVSVGQVFPWAVATRPEWRRPIRSARWVVLLAALPRDFLAFAPPSLSALLVRPLPALAPRRGAISFNDWLEIAPLTLSHRRAKAPRCGLYTARSSDRSLLYAGVFVTLGKVLSSRALTADLAACTSLLSPADALPRRFSIARAR